jgi:mannose-6-phosphate isomerase-like protein (cupin superfamily)
MVVTLEGGCRVSALRDGDPLTKDTLSIWNRIGRTTGAQSISLRVLEFAPGLSPGIRNEDCDEVLYVLGESEVSTIRGPGSPREQPAWGGGCGRVDLSIDGETYKVGPDSGLFIRAGQTFAIDNPGAASVTVISSQCPDPDRAPQFVSASKGPSSDSSSAPPPIVRLADRPAQPTADRWYRVLVDDDVGSTQVTQFVGSIPPGRAPDHFHNYEEVLVILKGEGRMWAGETNAAIKPGSCIYLPKGQVHCVENTGVDELRLLGVFYPAGSPSVRYDV